MKSAILKIPVLFMLSMSLAMSAQAAHRPDTLSADGLKSYFLLKLNLSTDPVDLNNYFHEVQFKKQFSAFADNYIQEIAKLGKPEAQILNTAILAALKGDFDQSEYGFNQSLRSTLIKDNQNLKMGIYSLMGLMMQLKGDLDQAANYQQQALDMAITLKDSFRMASTLMHLGHIKTLQAKYPAAEQYLIRMALPAFNRIKNKEGMVMCYRQIADSYLHQGLLSQARWFYVQSLSQARKISYQPGIITALAELGQLKYHAGDFELALKEWLEAEQLAITQHDLSALIRLKYNIAALQRQMGNTHSAEKYTRGYEQLKDILLNPVL